jgi:hypothetical protein
MCCFSGPVESVHSTNIFARVGDGDRQFIVYSMSVDAPADLAMILPLPVKTPAGEKDAHFIDLHDINAAFDHALYCQEHPDEHLKLWSEWQESRGHPRRFVFVEKTKGIVAPDQHCYKRELRGNLPNKDTYVAIERL